MSGIIWKTNNNQPQKLRTAKEMKITTQHVYPPIPIRTHDWMACLEDGDGDGPQGWGKTEAEAITDLKQQLEDEE